MKTNAASAAILGLSWIFCYATKVRTSKGSMIHTHALPSCQRNPTYFYALPKKSLDRRKPQTFQSANWAGLQAKLSQDQPVDVLLVGGTVSTMLWVDDLENWLLAILPSGSRFINYGCNYCGIQFHGTRMDSWQVDPDLVLLENSVTPWEEVGSVVAPKDRANTSQEDTFLENFLQKLSQRQPLAALLSIGLVSTENQFDTNASPHDTNQEVDLPILSKHGKPYCSLRDVIWPHIHGVYMDQNWTAAETPHVEAGKVTLDGVRPTDLTSKLLLDVVSACICEGLECRQGPASMCM